VEAPVTWFADARGPVRFHRDVSSVVEEAATEEADAE
jgi:hypothetical protein